MENLRKLKRVVIKEEIVAITGGETNLAIVLGQLMYWQERVNDYDQYIDEEEKRCAENGIESQFYHTHGWIYKKATDLIDECMLNISEKPMRAYLKKLEDMGYISSRDNPTNKWDKTKQYTVNTLNILRAVKDKGYSGIDGFREIQVTANKLSDLEETDVFCGEGETTASKGKNSRSMGINSTSSGRNSAAISETIYRDYMAEEKKEKNAYARENSVAAEASPTYARQRAHANDGITSNTGRQPKVPEYLAEQWQRWYNHVQTTSRPYTNVESMQLCIDELDQHCAGDCGKAERIISNAIKRRYDQLVMPSSKQEEHESENHIDAHEPYRTKDGELVIDGVIYR